METPARFTATTLCPLGPPVGDEDRPVKRAGKGWAWRRRFRPLNVAGLCAFCALLVVGLAGPAQSEALRPATRSEAPAYGFQGDFFQTSTRPQAIAAIKNAGFGWAK